MNNHRTNIRRSSLLTTAAGLAAAGILAGCAAAPSSLREGQHTKYLPERPASQVEIWVGHQPPGDFQWVASFSEKESLIVDARCSSRQRSMLELGARLEALEGLRERAAKAGLDGLMAIRCEGTSTARAFIQTCTADGFLYERGAGELAKVGGELGDPDRAGPDAARRAAFALSAKEIAASDEKAQN